MQQWLCRGYVGMRTVLISSPVARPVRVPMYFPTVRGETLMHLMPSFTFNSPVVRKAPDAIG